MARPSKLTADRQEKICQMIRSGVYAKVAVRACGLSAPAYYAWMARGREAELDDDGNAVNPDDQPYVDFEAAIREAEAIAEVESVALIRAAARPNPQTNAPGSWQAAAWYLERRSPERWGRREKVQAEFSGPAGGPIEVDAKTALLMFLDERAKAADEVEAPDEVPADGQPPA